jgi:hypothetical protein
MTGGSLASASGAALGSAPFCHVKPRLSSMAGAAQQLALGDLVVKSRVERTDHSAYVRYLRAPVDMVEFQQFSAAASNALPAETRDQLGTQRLTPITAVTRVRSNPVALMPLVILAVGGP